MNSEIEMIIEIQVVRLITTWEYTGSPYLRITLSIFSVKKSIKIPHEKM